MIGFGPLKKTLKERGMSVKDLAALMGKEPNHIGHMINFGNTDLNSVCMICRALGCNIGDVISRTDFQDRRVSVRWELLDSDIRSVMSLQKMALAIGKSKDSIYTAEKRGGGIMLSDLKKICEVLGKEESLYEIE